MNKKYFKKFNYLLDILFQKSDIISCCNNIEKEYETFIIYNKKRRIIYNPSNKLRLIQYIIKEYLENIYKSTKYNYGYIKNKSTKSAIINHMFIYHKKIDIKNFFESITYDNLYNFFIKHGLTKKNSILLSKLSTYKNKMILGSILSPIISNLVMYDIDKFICILMNNNNDDYYISRYADDFLISSNCKETVFYLYNLLYTYITKYKYIKFEINKKKENKNINTYLGINITNDNRLSISHKKVRLYMQASLFNHGKYGFSLKEIDKKTLGIINYIKYINKEQYNKLLKHYYKGKKFYENKKI